MLNMKPAVDCV